MKRLVVLILLIVGLLLLPGGWVVLAVLCSAPMHYFIFGKLMGAKRWWLLLALALAGYLALMVIAVIARLLTR